MGRTRELIEGIQNRVDDIETEATRLVVFANSTSDAALGNQLKKIAKTIFQSATEIEERIKKISEATNGRRERAK